MDWSTWKKTTSNLWVENLWDFTTSRIFIPTTCLHSTYSDVSVNPCNKDVTYPVHCNAVVQLLSSNCIWIQLILVLLLLNHMGPFQRCRSSNCAPGTAAGGGWGGNWKRISSHVIKWHWHTLIPSIFLSDFWVDFALNLVLTGASFPAKVATINF